jgi:hypothetical protein
MELIQQRYKNDCAVASLAMLQDKPYEEIFEALNYDAVADTGVFSPTLFNYLGMGIGGASDCPYYDTQVISELPLGIRKIAIIHNRKKISNRWREMFYAGIPISGEIFHMIIIDEFNDVYDPAEVPMGQYTPDYIMGVIPYKA